MHRMLIRDPDFEKGYKLGLGELDKATGGKKNSAEYVDVEMQETTTKGRRQETENRSLRCCVTTPMFFWKRANTTRNARKMKKSGNANGALQRG